MRKKNTIPSAFENAFGGLGYGNTMDTEETTNMDNVESTVDVETITTNNEPDSKKEPEVNTTENNTTVTNTEDNSEIPQEVLDQMNHTTDQSLGDDTEHDEPTADDVTEAQQVGALFDAVVESFGWNLDDIDEKDRPINVEGLTDYIREIVNQNSQPEYADERIEKLDAYVKNGGKFEDFYAAQQQEINYDNIDLEDESNQRTVIRELLRANGYTDQQINNKIDRYESADMLEEEAEDALSRLKVIKQQEAAELQQRQEAARIEQEEQNRAFFNDVTTQINNLSSIRGVAVPKEDRRALLDYIFKTDANGLSQYQKDFNKNLSKNLIESAYFTMRADSFVNEAKKAGQTTAAQKLRQMLRHSTKNHSSYNADEEKQRPAWEIASKFF